MLGWALLIYFTLGIITCAIAMYCRLSTEKNLGKEGKMTVCPNCNKDLTLFEEAVNETGHPLNNCPVCNFPIEILKEAKEKLGDWGFTISKTKPW